MAFDPILLGDTAGDGNGDTLRSAGSKINTQLRELYDRTTALPSIDGLIYGDGAGALSAVTIGTGLSFIDGTLSSTAATGTVTSVSVVTANGVSGTVATNTTTPAITLTLGAITPTSVNGLTISTSTGTLTVANGKTLTASNTLTIAGTDSSTLNIGAGGTLGSAAFTATSAYEVPLTFSTGLTRSTNTVTVNAIDLAASGSGGVTGNLPLIQVNITGGTQDLQPDATADYVATYDASATANRKVLLRDALVLRGYLSGFTLSNNGTDAANDIDIAAGTACDSTGVAMLNGAAMTKQLDATWAAGSAAGGRFSGVSESTSTWYHVFAIRKDSDGSVDYGFDTSLTAANKPAGYTYYRRIGSIYNDSGSSIRSFRQTGDYFEWVAPTLDVDTATLSTTSTSYSLASVPPGLSFRVNANIGVAHATASNGLVYLRNPSNTDSTPTATAAPMAVIRNPLVNVVHVAFAQFTTDTSQQVAARSTNASTTFRIAPLGYMDERGK